MTSKTKENIDLFEVTLATINAVFETKGEPIPFTAKSLNDIINKKGDTVTFFNTEIQNTELYESVKGSEFALSEPVDFQLIMKACFACKHKRVDGFLREANRAGSDFRNDLNAKLAADEDKIEAGALSQLVTTVMEVKREKDAKTNLAPDSKFVVNAVDIYDQQSRERDPVKAAIRAVKTILDNMQRVAEVSPLQLVELIRKKQRLPQTMDNFLYELVRHTVNTEDVQQQLNLKLTLGQSGLNTFANVVVHICTFTVKTIVLRIRNNFEVESYHGTDIRGLVLQCKENRVIMQALSHFTTYTTVATLLEYVEQSFPSLQHVVHDIMKLPSSTSPEKIFDTLCKEADHLNLSNDLDGAFNVRDNDVDRSLLRLDTGADSSIVHTSQLVPSTSKKLTKHWRAVGASQITTTDMGELRAKVQNIPPKFKSGGEGTNPEGNQKKSPQPKNLTMKLAAYASKDCNQSLLSTEDLYDQAPWTHIRINLTKEKGGSYIYTTGGGRIPLIRVEGRKGFYVRLYNHDCKSIYCSRIFSLIRINTGAIQPTDTMTHTDETQDGMLVIDNGIISFKPNYQPYDRNTFLEFDYEDEAEIYDSMTGLCRHCYPRRVLKYIPDRYALEQTNNPQHTVACVLSEWTNSKVTKQHQPKQMCINSCQEEPRTHTTDSSPVELTNNTAQLDIEMKPAGPEDDTENGDTTPAHTPDHLVDDPIVATAKLSQPDPGTCTTDVDSQTDSDLSWLHEVIETIITKVCEPKTQLWSEMLKSTLHPRSSTKILKSAFKPSTKQQQGDIDNLNRSGKPSVKFKLNTNSNSNRTLSPPAKNTNDWVTVHTRRRTPVNMTTDSTRSRQNRFAILQSDEPDEQTEFDECPNTQSTDSLSKDTSSQSKEPPCLNQNEAIPLVIPKLMDEMIDEITLSYIENREFIPEEELIKREQGANPSKVRLGKDYYARARKDYMENDKVTLTDIDEVFLLHELFGHTSLSKLKSMYRINIPRRYTAFACEACDAAKMTRTNSRKIYQRSGETGRQCAVGEEWHMDLMFMPTDISYRKGHIVSTRIDAGSRKADTLVIKRKSSALLTLKIFIARSKSGKPKRIKVDRGMEYLNKAFRQYCIDNGIDLIPSGSYQHGQRGLAERFNRTIKEHTFACLLTRNAPPIFWPEAIKHIVYIYNHTSHSGIQNRKPAEVEAKHPIDTWNIKGVFGCLVKVLSSPDQKHKPLKQRYREGVFLGVDPYSSMGTYCVLMTDTGRLTYASEHIIFENLIPGKYPSKYQSNPAHEALETFMQRKQPSQESARIANPDVSNSDISLESSPELQYDTEQPSTPTPTPIPAEHTILEPKTDPQSLTVPPVRKSTRAKRRPEYFLEHAQEIYNAPQVQTSGEINHMTSDVHTTTTESDRQYTADECTQGIPLSVLMSAREADGITGDIYSCNSLPASTVDAPATGPYAQRIEELRLKVQRDKTKELTLGQPPKSYRLVSQALSKTNPYRDQVLAAMELELLTLYTMGTFHIRPDSQLTPEQRRTKAIGTKWVFAVKENLFKARLVARGYMQDTTGIFTYSPTLRKETIRQIFAKAARTGHRVRSLDIRNAFIREPSNRELFILRPFMMGELLDVDLKGVKRIKLDKMLYGLSESPVVFYNGLAKHLNNGKYRRSFSDPCHFKKQNIDIGFHVDDGLYVGSDQAVKEFERHMRDYYALKDVGECRLFTGLRAIQTEDAVYVHQIPFIKALIQQYLNDTVNYSFSAQTPMGEKLKLEPPTPDSRTDPEAGHLPYKELRCSLMWLACGTRLDIAYAVSVLGAYDHCYNKTLYKYLLRILKYLQGTVNLCIRYSRTSASEEAQTYLSQWPRQQVTPSTGLFADASCLTPSSKYKGRGGYLMMVQGGPISWSTHTLRGTSLGSYDAEFKNLSKACMDGARVQDSLVEFDLMNVRDRLPVLSDCTTAIQAMERPAGASKKCGHIEKHYYFVQEKIESRMKLSHVHTQFMLADLLTKPVGRQQFQKLRDEILHSLPSDLQEVTDQFFVDTRASAHL